MPFARVLISLKSLSHTPQGRIYRSAAYGGHFRLRPYRARHASHPQRETYRDFGPASIISLAWRNLVPACWRVDVQNAPQDPRQASFPDWAVPGPPNNYREWSWRFPSGAATSVNRQQHDFNRFPRWCGWRTLPTPAFHLVREPQRHYTPRLTSPLTHLLAGFSGCSAVAGL